MINSFAAGFAIGAPIGGVANLKKTTEADLLQGTPPEDTDASPAEPGMPEGSTQQELFPEDTDLGTAAEVDPDVAALRAQDEVLRREVVADLEKDNYLEATESHCALTRKGRAYLDSITSMLIA